MSPSLRPKQRRFTNRDGNEAFAFELPLKNRALGMSALVRVKDEAQKIEHCLRSILPVFDEIVVVDNASTDDTVAIVRGIQASADIEGKIQLHFYPFELARFGPEHAEMPADSLHSAVYFTNWALSHCTRRYVCKWDGDMVLIGDQRAAFVELVARVRRRPAGAWSLAGQTVYRALDGTFYSAQGEVNREVEIFPCSYRCMFQKAKHWEQLARPKTMRTHRFEPVCFYELKFLDADEFAHWSTTDWPSDRKKLEWENFHRVREGRVDSGFDRLPPTLLDDQLESAPTGVRVDGRHARAGSGDAVGPAKQTALTRLMPHFLGIGAMRSGTTWLATQLATHPQIRMDRKEIHFFDQKLERLGRPGSRRDVFNQVRYLARFAFARGSGALRGEITPSYALLEPRVIARILRWMPEVRLLFLMRDPIERAWSQARNDFPAWWGKAIRDVGRDELIRYFETDAVRHRSDYVRCLRRWMGSFPPEQFFFGFMDDIRQRPAELLRDAFAFLGADPERAAAGPLDLPVGSSEPAPMPDWVRDHLDRMWSFDTDELAELVGREVPWAR